MTKPTWTETFVDPIIAQIGPYPVVFLRFLAERTKDHPEAVPVFAAALEDMGRWYIAQAAGLDAVRDLRRITKAEAEAE